MAKQKKEIIEEATIKEEKAKKETADSKKSTKKASYTQTHEKTNEEKSTADKLNDFINDVEDKTKEYSQEEINNGKLLAAISYIGIISVIVYLVEKENNFVKFHAKQGINLFVDSLILTGILSALNGVLLISIIGIPFIPLIDFIAALIPIVLMVIGIINVCKGLAKELPIVNKFMLIK